MLGCDSQVPTTKQTRGNYGPRLWVIHDEEYPEGPNSAERVAASLAASPRRASIQACVDQNTVVGMVDWVDSSWHAGHGATNACSAGVEHDGYAHQSLAEWLDDAGGAATLDRSARLFATVGMAHFGIKPHRLTGQALRECVLHSVGSGVCGHKDVTEAFSVAGGHTDPGDQFPYDWWLARAVWHTQPKPTTKGNLMDAWTTADGREEFLLVIDGRVHHAWQAAAGQQQGPYVPLTSPNGFAPINVIDVAGACDGNGVADVRALTSDGQLWHIWQSAPGNGWSQWVRER